MKKGIIILIFFLSLVAISVSAKQRDLIGVDMIPNSIQNINIGDYFTMTCFPIILGNGAPPTIVYTAQWCDTNNCLGNVYNIGVGTSGDVISLESNAVNPETITGLGSWSYNVYGTNSGTVFIRCKTVGGTTCINGCYSNIEEVNVNEILNYDDVIFDSNFEMGNLKNVVYINGNSNGERWYEAEINYTTVLSPEYHWWFYFSVENITNKNIHIKLKNLASTDFTNNRWPNLHPRYSYDNSVWYEVSYDSVSYSSLNKWFSFSFLSTQDKVWFAPAPPYTISRRDNLLNNYLTNQYVNIETLAISPSGLEVKAVIITDPSYSNENKHKVYIIAQQHSGEESQGSWAAEGAIEFLLSEDQMAQDIRQKFIFKIIPIMNVDGAYYGVGRFTLLYNNVQYDLNREWTDARLQYGNVYQIVNLTYIDIGNFNPDIFLDWHGSLNGESSWASPFVNYYFTDGLNDNIMTNFLQTISKWWEYDLEEFSHTGGSQTSQVNVYSGLGVHPSVNFEWTINPVSDTEFPDNYDWERHGKNHILAIYDYYGYFNDSIPPFVNIIEPLENENVSNIAIIRANASDDIGISDVYYKIDDGNYIEMNLNNELWEGEWDTTQYNNGLHTITVITYDYGNNFGIDMVSVNVYNEPNTLNVVVTTDKPQYTAGEFVYTITEVRDNQNNLINNADVTVNIYKSSGSLAKNCVGLSSNGVFSCNYKIKNNDPLGIYVVESDASKSGYIAGHGETSFEVI